MSFRGIRTNVRLKGCHRDIVTKYASMLLNNTLNVLEINDIGQGVGMEPLVSAREGFSVDVGNHLVGVSIPQL